MLHLTGLVKYFITPFVTFERGFIVEKKLINKMTEKKSDGRFNFVHHDSDAFIKSEPSLEALCKHFSVKYDKSLRKLAL